MPLRSDLARGADPNVPDEEGWTPLHHAAHYCHVDVVRLLLAHPRVNMHARSKMGWTPLDTAGVLSSAPLFIMRFCR